MVCRLADLSDIAQIVTGLILASAGRQLPRNVSKIGRALFSDRRTIAKALREMAQAGLIDPDSKVLRVDEDRVRELREEAAKGLRDLLGKASPPVVMIPDEALAWRSPALAMAAGELIAESVARRRSGRKGGYVRRDWERARRAGVSREAIVIARRKLEEDGILRTKPVRIVIGRQPVTLRLSAWTGRGCKNRRWWVSPQIHRRMVRFARPAILSCSRLYKSPTATIKSTITPPGTGSLKLSSYSALRGKVARESAIRGDPWEARAWTRQRPRAASTNPKPSHPRAAQSGLLNVFKWLESPKQRSGGGVSQVGDIMQPHTRREDPGRPEAEAALDRERIERFLASGASPTQQTEQLLAAAHVLDQAPKRRREWAAWLVRIHGAATARKLAAVIGDVLLDPKVRRVGAVVAKRIRQLLSPRGSALSHYRQFWTLDRFLRGEARRSLPRGLKQARELYHQGMALAEIRELTGVTASEMSTAGS